MTEANGPTLDDDEAQLQVYAEQLVTAVALVVEPWLLCLIANRDRAVAVSREAKAAAATGAEAIVAELRDLLKRDIADQEIGPLEVMRRGVHHATAVLSASKVDPVVRDDFSRRNFPEDVYDLTPASFQAIDPSLHEPGLMWGAAKAHVHLRRRRDA